MTFEKACPICHNELIFDILDPYVYCETCDRSFEFDWDYDYNDEDGESYYAWIIGEGVEGDMRL